MKALLVALVVALIPTSAFSDWRYYPVYCDQTGACPTEHITGIPDGGAEIQAKCGLQSDPTTWDRPLKLHCTASNSLTCKHHEEATEWICNCGYSNNIGNFKVNYTITCPN
ncbi:hypothetical protein [Bauldia sp.]|uniref:hypothetical protein n=1 Tax=Bauldia sp. TaxID=2575872 RepID=UPI003BA9727B